MGVQNGNQWFGLLLMPEVAACSIGIGCGRKGAYHAPLVWLRGKRKKGEKEEKKRNNKREGKRLGVGIAIGNSNS